MHIGHIAQAFLYRVYFLDSPVAWPATHPNPSCPMCLSRLLRFVILAHVLFDEKFDPLVLPNLDAFGCLFELPQRDRVKAPKDLVHGRLRDPEMSGYRALRSPGSCQAEHLFFTGERFKVVRPWRRVSVPSILPAWHLSLVVSHHVDNLLCDNRCHVAHTDPPVSTNLIYEEQKGVIEFVKKYSELSISPQCFGFWSTPWLKTRPRHAAQPSV